MITKELYKELFKKFEVENGLLQNTGRSFKNFIGLKYLEWIQIANAKGEEKNGPTDEEKVKEYLNSKLYQMLGTIEWIGSGKETFNFKNRMGIFYYAQALGLGGLSK